MTEISLDLETLSTSPAAAIASIGAVVFSLEEPDSHQDIFYRVVDDSSGDVSARTIRWHAEQEGNTLGSNKDAISLEHALKDLRYFFLKHKSLSEGDYRVWSHATFDMPVLTSAYHRIQGVNPEIPWDFRNTRDLRTLYDLAGGRPDVEFVGTHHNALDDAIYQMKEIRACFSILKPLHTEPVHK